jgi:hypothetical protein
MEQRWINICEREPELKKEVQVMVVDSAIEYASAKLTRQGWVFLTSTISTQVVAWVESDRFLTARELSDLPKDGIRLPLY